MAQEVESRSLRSLDPTSCILLTVPSKCFVWCYGPEFVAKDSRKWLAKIVAMTPYIEPGSPWGNGYCESFNSKLRDEILNGEIVHSMKEQRVLAERWRVHYNDQASALAGLQTTGAGGMADFQHGAWRSGNRYALPTSPHPHGGYPNPEIAALH